MCINESTSAAEFDSLTRGRMKTDPVRTSDGANICLVRSAGHEALPGVLCLVFPPHRLDMALDKLIQIKHLHIWVTLPDSSRC